MIADDGATLPFRATKRSAGYDVYPAEEMTLEPDTPYIIDTHVRLTGKEKVFFNGRPCSDWFLAVYPRSSFGKKYRFSLLNTVGLIDADFPDNILVMCAVKERCHLTPEKPFVQFVIQEYGRFSDETEPEKERTGGIGSTSA